MDRTSMILLFELILKRMILRALTAISITVATTCHGFLTARINRIPVDFVWRCSLVAAELHGLPADLVVTAVVVVIVGV